jgi:hypothetical protein
MIELGYALAIAALLGSAAPAAAREAKVTICHIPPGNPSAYVELTVGASALAAHLAHGDFNGRCADDCNLHPAVCDDGDGCTVDACTSSGTCTHAPVTSPAGESCDAPSGACVAPTLTCTNDGTPIGSSQLPSSVLQNLPSYYPNSTVVCVYQLQNGNYEIDLLTSDQRFLAVDFDTRGNIISETVIP